MKTKCILILLALFSFGRPGVAQKKSRCQLQPQSLAHAKEYLSPDGRFRICFPDVPKELDLPFDTKVGPIVSHSLIYNSDVTYWLNYIDYPIHSVPPDAVKQLLDNARDSGLARVAKEDPRIIAESDIAVEGYPGRYFRVELKGDAILRHKIVLAGNRLYVISVGTPKGDAETTNQQNTYEKVANSFFDSFKIIPLLAADLTATWKEFSSTEGKFKIQFPGTPYQSSLMGAGRNGSKMNTTAYQSSIFYTVSYVDDPQMPTDPAALKTYLDNQRIGEFEWLAQQGVKSTILRDTDIIVGGYPGRFLVAELSTGDIYRRKLVIVKNRFFFHRRYSSQN
jgi:hypothetical protein